MIIKAHRPTTLRDGWYIGCIRGRACCFVSGHPLCGRQVIRRPVPAGSHHGAIGNCTECADINDGLWYIDGLRRAEDALEERLAADMLERIELAEKGGAR